MVQYPIFASSLFNCLMICHALSFSTPVILITSLQSQKYFFSCTCCHLLSFSDGIGGNNTGLLWCFYSCPAPPRTPYRILTPLRYSLDSPSLQLSILSILTTSFWYSRLTGLILFVTLLLLFLLWITLLPTSHSYIAMSLSSFPE